MDKEGAGSASRQAAWVAGRRPLGGLYQLHLLYDEVSA
jgi:hypothetical protein